MAARHRNAGYFVDAKLGRALTQFAGWEMPHRHKIELKADLGIHRALKIAIVTALSLPRVRYDDVMLSAGEDRDTYRELQCCYRT